MAVTSQRLKDANYTTSAPGSSSRSSAIKKAAPKKAEGAKASVKKASVKSVPVQKIPSKKRPPTPVKKSAPVQKVPSAKRPPTPVKKAASGNPLTISGRVFNPRDPFGFKSRDRAAEARRKNAKDKGSMEKMLSGMDKLKKK